MMLCIISQKIFIGVKILIIINPTPLNHCFFYSGDKKNGKVFDISNKTANFAAGTRQC